MFLAKETFRMFNIIGDNMIYADNAATTKLDIKAYEAMTPWLLDEYGNASQPYSFARMPKRAIAEARATIANCIGAFPEEIYFTSGGTEGDNWVIKGTALASSVSCSIITSAFEHHAILHSCSRVEKLGHEIKYLEPTNDGIITPNELEKQLSGNTKLVSVMLANNEIGSIQPIKELCEVAHDNGALFHTDAVQAVGHISIDVHELGVDLMSASAHKFNGPKGIGFLYIRKGIDLDAYIDGGSQESGLRSGTENVASIVGMAVALKDNCERLYDNQTHLKKLEESLLNTLRDNKVRFHLNGSEDRLPGLLSLSFPGKDGEAILHRMDLMGISISTGSACDSVNTEISHVLKAIKLQENLAKGTVRISLGRSNTLEEAIIIANNLSKITH